MSSFDLLGPIKKKPKLKSGSLLELAGLLLKQRNEHAKLVVSTNTAQKWLLALANNSINFKSSLFRNMILSIHRM